MNKEKLSYGGKKVYLGIDVHKKSYSVTVMYKGEVVKRDKMRADAQALCRYVKTHFKGAQVHSVYEAGFSGYSLHRILVEGGIKNIVINPASVERAANDKVKTDRVDSRKLAEQLSAGRLKGIYIPSKDQEQARSLTRTRDQIVEHRKLVSNQIKSKLHYFGLMRMDDKRRLSERYLKELEGQELGKYLSYSLRLLIEQWRFLNAQIKELRQKLEEQARENKQIEVYRSVPGIGEVGAPMLANELGDLSKRFVNERKNFSFTGLTPGEHSSGESERKGAISRQGSPRIRKYLIEVAWRAIYQDQALLEAFERIAKTRGRKRAIVAIARKLIGRIRACFKQGCLYQVGVVA